MMAKQHVIIGGVHKAGTTSLYTYLTWHPEICGSSIKETHYFSKNIKRHGYTPVFSSYGDYFKACSDKPVYVEASPEYIYGGRSVAIEISRQLENPFVYFILREPIDKLFSSFKHQQKRLIIDKHITFDQYVSQHFDYSDLSDKRIDSDAVALELLEGCYINYLPDWVEIFGRERIRILFFDDLIKDPASVVSVVCRDIGIDDAFYSLRDFSIENRSVIMRSNRLAAMAEKLARIMEPQIRQHYWLKKTLRSLYFFINAKDNDDKVSVTTQNKLNRLYSEYNKMLAEKLRAYGYSNLPEWLSIHLQ